MTMMYATPPSPLLSSILFLLFSLCLSSLSLSLSLSLSSLCSLSLYSSLSSPFLSFSSPPLPLSLLSLLSISLLSSFLSSSLFLSSPPLPHSPISFIHTHAHTLSLPHLSVCLFDIRARFMPFTLACFGYSFYFLAEKVGR